MTAVAAVEVRLLEGASGTSPAPAPSAPPEPHGAMHRRGRGPPYRTAEAAAGMGAEVIVIGVPVTAMR